MKTKYAKKLVFWNDKSFMDKSNKSPYMLILNIESEYRPKLTGGDRLSIEYIDRFGNHDVIKTTKHYLYTKVEILDREKSDRLLHDFIEGIFDKAR